MQSSVVLFSESFAPFLLDKLRSKALFKPQSQGGTIAVIINMPRLKPSTGTSFNMEVRCQFYNENAYSELLVDLFKSIIQVESGTYGCLSSVSCQDLSLDCFY